MTARCPKTSKHALLPALLANGYQPMAQNLARIKASPLHFWRQGCVVRHHFFPNTHRFRVEGFRALAQAARMDPVPKMQRKGKKRREESGYQHTSSHIQILGNGTDTGDTCPSVLLFFDQYRFVFNAGEGFQRYCFQHKVKLGKMKDLFLTRMSMEAAGGLPGLLITLTENGIGGLLAGGTPITVHGPRNLGTFMDAIRTFVSIEQTNLTASNFGAQEGTEGQLLEPLVENNQVVIRPMVILPKDGMREEETGNESDGSEGGRRKRARKSEDRSDGSDGSRGAAGTIEGIAAACYVCELAEQKGKFRPEKAQALGVPRGPLYKELVKGNAVQVSDGKTVQPHEVLDPSVPGPVVIVVDCPDMSYVASLASAKGLDQYLRKTSGSTDEGSNSDKEERCIVVHLGPVGVVSSKEYGEWVGRFPPASKHMFVNLQASGASAVMRQSTVVQAKLNMVDEDFFPLPCTVNVAGGGWDEGWLKDDYIMGKDLAKFHLKPDSKRGVDFSEVPGEFVVEEAKSKLAEYSPKAVAEMEKYKERSQNLKNEVKQKIGADELEVTFLGTGSAIPSKYRNVTGMFLDFFEKGGMFLDCGEGSYGQFVRRFGVKGAEQRLRNLRCVWISHIHADHHAGLPRLLSARRKLLGPGCPPILVIGPPLLYRTMTSYSKLEPLNYGYLFCANTEENSGKNEEVGVGSKRGPTQAVLDEFQNVKEALGLVDFESFLVQHCRFAYGVKLVSKSGWKVVFSGDCRPCESVVKAAKDATLLIHEATFEEDMQDEAVKKKHSTTQEALSIASQAGAYRTILTHFSQRYPKIPVLPGNLNSVGIAFDLMSVNLANLDRLPGTVEPCKYLFDVEANSEVEGDADIW